jgi:hypothetical protein
MYNFLEVRLLKPMLLFAWRFNRLIENLFIDKRIRRESYENFGKGNTIFVWMIMHFFTAFFNSRKTS